MYINRIILYEYLAPNIKIILESSAAALIILIYIIENLKWISANLLEGLLYLKLKEELNL